MERITGKEVKTMMEAYASVYKTEEQQTLSEGYGKDCVKKERKTKHNCAKKVCHEEYGEGETIFGQHAAPDENGFVSHYNVQFEHGIVENVSVEDLEVLTEGVHPEHTEMEGEKLEENRNQRGAAARANRQAAAAAAAAQGNSGGPTSPSGGALSMRDRIFARRSASPAAQANTNRVGQNIKVGSPTGPAQNDQLKKPTATGTAPAAPTSMANKAPAGAERRLPTSAELRAAQQARRDAPKVLSRGEIENRAVQAGVGVAKGTVKDPKIAADAARKAELAALQAKAKADTMKKKQSPDTSRMGARNRMRMEEVDIFDTIKEYLIGEGATEEEALKQMLTLTDEQRTEILEGSCGSKPKKKGGYKK